MKKRINLNTSQSSLRIFESFIDEIVNENLLDSSTVGAFSVLCFQIFENMRENDHERFVVEVTGTSDSVWVNWELEKTSYLLIERWMQVDGKDYFDSINSVYFFQDETRQFGFELQFTGLQQKLSANRRKYLENYLRNKKVKHSIS